MGLPDDQCNRLLNLALTRSDNSYVRGYTYSLSAVGCRKEVAEYQLVDDNLRRYVTYEYDKTYATIPAQTGPRVGRLTRENLSNAYYDSAGVITHTYDKVGNRTVRAVTGTLPFGNQSFTSDARDQLANYSNAYDPNGNTVMDEAGNATQDLYDAENHLIQRGSDTITYDHEGNRVRKTFGGVTTYYLLDDRNPSGYVQVLAEYVNTANAPTRAYTYGHDLIAERLDGTTTVYYGYDGQGSVRMLLSAATGSSTAITDTYDYDAYGQLLASTGTTPNHYRYTGEQWDGDLGMYYLRARYLNPNTGRFWTMDTFEGIPYEPTTLHRYLYGADNPVNMVDPTGKWATFIHKMAARSQLKGLLSDKDVEVLCDMQDEVDGEENQTAAKSFMHAMRDGETKETVDHAKQAANNRIRTLLTLARELEAEGKHEKAIKEVGRAMHTLQDSTSPAHHGFQPWYDYPGGVGNPHEWMHGGKESIYPGTGSWLETATLRTYNYFKGSSMPSDFFGDLGADGVLEGPKEKIRRFRIPSFDFWLGSSIGGGFGAAF